MDASVSLYLAICESTAQNGIAFAALRSKDVSGLKGLAKEMKDRDLPLRIALDWILLLVTGNDKGVQVHLLDGARNLFPTRRELHSGLAGICGKPPTPTERPRCSSPVTPFCAGYLSPGCLRRISTRLVRRDVWEEKDPSGRNRLTTRPWQSVFAQERTTDGRYLRNFRTNDFEAAAQELVKNNPT